MRNTCGVDASVMTSNDLTRDADTDNSKHEPILGQCLVLAGGGGIPHQQEPLVNLVTFNLFHKNYNDRLKQNTTNL